MVGRRRIQREYMRESVGQVLSMLFVLSYVLSPSHLATFIVRVVSHGQFAHPDTLHPDKSLRFIVFMWSLVNGGALLVHAIDGSKGAKGDKWSGHGGIIIDFVGQSYIPSKLHMLAVDALIAVLQLFMIAVAFDAKRRSSASWRSARETRRRERRRREAAQSGTSERSPEDEGEGEGEAATRTDEQDALLAQMDEHQPESDVESDSDDSGSEESDSELVEPTVRKPGGTRDRRERPLVDIRLRRLWREMRTGQTAAAQEEAASSSPRISAMEEGRSPTIAV